ncbi:hypothetical protein BHE74_00010513 [Ensete ventricosum]|nr:hypothetical protein BHE74_00010513 [Ensete ventricosum]RZR87053.1 hypothetical protein BHM03_00014368 [Ensete ventricosum]
MASSSGSLDYWRKFFRSANSDIFEVMEHAILVGASDYPQEFRSRRHQIVEKLFAVLLPRCCGCDPVAEGEEGDRSVKRDGEKESKVDSSNDGPEDLNRIVSNYSYDEAEALTEEIEEESQIVGEVLRIKEIFANHRDEAVNCLRRHNSKQIRHLVRTLIENNGEFEKPWENGGTPENDVPHRKQQPPKQYVIPKEKAETRRQEPSQFITPEGKEVTRRQLPPHSAIVEDKSQMKQQKTVMRPGKPQVPGIGQGRCDGIENRQSKPVLLDSGPGRPPKLPHTQNAGRQMKPKQHQDSGALRRKLLVVPQDVSSARNSRYCRSGGP